MKHGERACINRTTELYRADDEPGIIGELQAGALVTVLIGPHMGRRQVRTDDGLVGWVAVGSFVPAQPETPD